MRNLINFYNFKKNIKLILHNEKILKNKVILLLIYFKLLSRYFIFERLLKIKLKEENVFGYNLRLFDYSNFIYLFEEVFILKEYEFEPSKNSPLIIDCGSNIGISILFFKKFYPNSRIICFEPDEKTFQILKLNIIKNKLSGIFLNKAAIYDKNGKVEFYSDANLEGSLGMAITSHFIEQWGGKVNKNIVDSVKLSDYINEPIDLLKIDIEGAEERVIKELIKNKKLNFIKEMIVEYHYNKDHPKNRLGIILRLLEKNEFKFIINSPLQPPYFIYQNKPYYLLIYAYK